MDIFVIDLKKMTHTVTKVFTDYTSNLKLLINNNLPHKLRTKNYIELGKYRKKLNSCLLHHTWK